MIAVLLQELKTLSKNREPVNNLGFKKNALDKTL